MKRRCDAPSKVSLRDASLEWTPDQVRGDGDLCHAGLDPVSILIAALCETQFIQAARQAAFD